MGSVWRAEHLGWEAPVAVKLMNRDVAELPEARARFEREVRLAAELRSPHVVQVLDHGVDESTRIPFIAMELLEGESLDARLRRRGPLSPAETLEIISQVVRALSRAHEAGVVHRDLKPENIFLVRNEEQSLVKILDFGIAKGSRPNLAARLTRPGRVLGTPFYMSPEQFRGTGEIDQRADLWSLGAITCECLTGRRPFEAKDLGELALLLLRNTGRPLPSQLGPVPAGFDAWFLRATHPELEQRFQSARQLGNELARVCASSSHQPAAGLGPTEELPADSEAGLGAAVRLLSGTRLRWTPARIAGAALLLTLPVGAGALWQYRRTAAAAGGELPSPAAALTSPPEVARLGLLPAPPATATAEPPPLSGEAAVGNSGGGAAALPAVASAVSTLPGGAPGHAAAPAASTSAPASTAAEPKPPAEARSGSRAARRKQRPARAARSVKRERAAEPAQSELPAVDINGRPILMTLDSSP